MSKYNSDSALYIAINEFAASDFVANVQSIWDASQGGLIGLTAVGVLWVSISELRGYASRRRQAAR